MKQFSVDVQRDDGPVRVVLGGELDIATYGEAELILRELQESGAPVVVIDLRKLTFMDSTGLRLLVQADLRARESGHQLLIVRGPDAVHRVLEITGLDAKLKFVDDPAGAGVGTD